MKKILIAVAAAIPFLAVADNENEVMSANTFGVLRLNPSTTVTPITANFGSVESAGNQDIVVSNLLKTTNLTLGDRLYVYNTTSESETKWNAYELAEDGSGNRFWDACNVASVTIDGTAISASKPQDGSEIHVGQGVFLVRQNTGMPFYAFGQVQTGAVVTAISDGANLIGAPFGTNYNFAAARLYTNAACTAPYTPVSPSELDTRTLPSGKVVTNSVYAAGDKLVIIANDGKPSEYIYQDGAWGSAGNNGEPVIPAGIGCWYYKDGGSTVYIKWGENE